MSKWEARAQEWVACVPAVAGTPIAQYILVHHKLPLLLLGAAFDHCSIAASAGLLRIIVRLCVSTSDTSQPIRRGPLRTLPHRITASPVYRGAEPERRERGGSDPVLTYTYPPPRTLMRPFFLRCSAVAAAITPV
ncbi:hypothetical protein C8R44DRAFT_895260 [Mycena epipterygia]|nr:hypothetical protein C8R44DRAFT_895260 [Mycena epipterygia]